MSVGITSFGIRNLSRARYTLQLSVVLKVSAFLLMLGHKTRGRLSPVYLSSYVETVQSARPIAKQVGVYR